MRKDKEIQAKSKQNTCYIESRYIKQTPATAPARSRPGNCVLQVLKLIRETFTQCTESQVNKKHQNEHTLLSIIEYIENQCD